MEEKLLLIVIGIIVSLLLFLILYLPNKKTVKNAKKVVNNYLDEINSDINIATDKIINEKMNKYYSLLTFYKTNPNSLTKCQGKKFLDKLQILRKNSVQFKDIFGESKQKS